MGCSMERGGVEGLAGGLADFGVDDVSVLIQLDTDENRAVAGAKVIRLYLVDGLGLDHHGAFVVVRIGDDLRLNVF